MPLYAHGIARKKHGLTFKPLARHKRATNTWAHGVFVAHARAVEYEKLARTCVAAPSLTTAAAVLVERFCCDNGVTPALFAQLLEKLQAFTGHDVGEFAAGAADGVDFTELPADALHQLVLHAPTWLHQIKPRSRTEWTTTANTESSVPEGD